MTPGGFLPAVANMETIVSKSTPKQRTHDFLTPTTHGRRQRAGINATLGRGALAFIPCRAGQCAATSLDVLCVCLNSRASGRGFF